MILLSTAEMFQESSVVTVNQNRKRHKLEHCISIDALFIRTCLLKYLILLHAEGWFMCVVKYKLIAQTCNLASKIQQNT